MGGNTNQVTPEVSKNAVSLLVFHAVFDACRTFRVAVKNPRNARNGEEGLSFYSQQLATASDLEMFGAFPTWPFAMVEVSFSYRIFLCCSSAVFRYLLPS